MAHLVYTSRENNMNLFTCRILKNDNSGEEQDKTECM